MQHFFKESATKLHKRSRRHTSNLLYFNDFLSQPKNAQKIYQPMCFYPYTWRTITQFVETCQKPCVIASTHSHNYMDMITLLVLAVLKTPGLQISFLGDSRAGTLGIIKNKSERYLGKNWEEIDPNKQIHFVNVWDENIGQQIFKCFREQHLVFEFVDTVLTMLDKGEPKQFSLGAGKINIATGIFKVAYYHRVPIVPLTYGLNYGRLFVKFHPAVVSGEDLEQSSYQGLLFGQTLL